MTPVNITCPTPTAIWGTDPAIAGAIVGALIAGLAAWATSWWAEKGNKRQRQLEAVADFLTSTENAVAAWRSVAKEQLPRLTNQPNIYWAHQYWPEPVQTLIHAHREVIAATENAVEILDLRLTNKHVRAELENLRTAVAEYITSLEDVENTLQRPVRLTDGFGDPLEESKDSAGAVVKEVLQSDGRLPFLVRVPGGGSLQKAANSLVSIARKHLT